MLVRCNICKSKVLSIDRFKGNFTFSRSVVSSHLQNATILLEVEGGNGGKKYP